MHPERIDIWFFFSLALNEVLKKKKTLTACFRWNRKQGEVKKWTMYACDKTHHFSPLHLSVTSLKEMDAVLHARGHISLIK